MLTKHLLPNLKPLYSLSCFSSFSSLSSLCPLISKSKSKYAFNFCSTPKKQKQQKFKVIETPKQATKLIFNRDGKCRIFEHKNGQRQMKWIMRVGTFVTVLNSFLVGMEMSQPIFGAWNMFSFSVCAGLGYLFLGLFWALAKRTVHKIQLENTLETVDVTFFNPFWKPMTKTFHISQFQQPYPSYAGFTGFEITSIGKAWIKLSKNEFRNVQDYEQTLDYILLGKKIQNVKLSKAKKGA